MAKLDIHNLKNEKVGTIDLDNDVFAGEVKEHLFHEVVRNQLANRRAGTHSTKTRANVTASGRKPFKQKGTGRARQGDVKVPIHRGGGVAHGPLPRDYSYTVPRKVRKAAVRSALSRRLTESKLWVLEDFELGQVKTKEVVDICSRFGWENALLVDGPNETLQKSARNIPSVQYLPREGLNCYDLLRFENIVLTKAAVEHITGVFSK
jgi:large subunit ribosomal protein L4